MDQPKESEIQLKANIEINKEFVPQTYEEWKAMVDAELEGVPFDKKLLTATYENIMLRPLYTKNDYNDKNEFPGFYHFSRSNKVDGYLNNSWLISQELLYGDADEFNSALKYDIERGLSAINIKLDLATIKGFDADYSNVEDVGEGGLSISGMNSLSRALKDVNLTKYPIFISTGFSALPIMIIFLSYLKKNNIDFKYVKGSIEADPINYLVKFGELPVSLDFAFKKMKLTTEYVIKNNLNLRTIGVSSLQYHNAGASAVQELAFAMSTMVEYISQLQEHGLTPKDTHNKIKLSFGVGPFFFMEIAKLRAARILFSNIMREYGINENEIDIFIHADTSSFNQTIYDPYANTLRATTETFSAILGGVDSLNVNNFDKPFGLPDELSRRLARNTQLIFKEECNLNKLIDPAGGSFYIEKLTEEVAQKSWEIFQEIEKQGGILESLKNNYPQKLIEQTNEKRNQDLFKRKSVLVGTNMFANTKETKLEFKRIDKIGLQKKRAEYLQKFRVSAAQEKDLSILDKLNTLLNSDDTRTIDTGIDAILEGATLGEITRAIRATTHESIKINKLENKRLAEPFEKIREKTEEITKKTGSKPKIFLATMGSMKQYKGRADFSREFFEVAGFEVIYPNGFIATSDMLKEVEKHSPVAVVICSTDDNYPDLVEPIVTGIKSLKNKIVVLLAGYPKDYIEIFKKEGIDDFIFLGVDTHKFFLSLLEKIGE
ncbi:MAG: acyl-CoA mutase large subunit family protein [Ignavibacteriales bacterium]|nr:acyl-CoA mutase large subunit family protein [Ignavibacteriales bacterium]